MEHLHLYVGVGMTEEGGHDVLDMDFYAEHDFDLILLMDIIEHLDKEDGIWLLTELQHRWPKANLCVFTPLGFHANTGEGSTDPNHPQFHRSGWERRDFEQFELKTMCWPDFHGLNHGAILAWSSSAWERNGL